MLQNEGAGPFSRHQGISYRLQKQAETPNKKVKRKVRLRERNVRDDTGPAVLRVARDGAAIETRTDASRQTRTDIDI